MKTTTFRNAALAAALALVAACGRVPLPEKAVTGSSCPSLSSSTSSAPLSTSSYSGAAGQGGMPDTTSRYSSGGGRGGTGGSHPAAFSADCTGLVDCPMLDGCVRWDYNVVDDGTTSTVNASVTVLLPSPLPPCTGMTTFSDADAVPDSINTIDVPCGTQTWSLGLDRSTMTVYLKEEPVGLSWTPACQ